MVDLVKNKDDFDFPIKWTLKPGDRAFAICCDILTIFESVYIALGIVRGEQLRLGLANYALGVGDNKSVQFRFQGTLFARLKEIPILELEFLFSENPIAALKGEKFDASLVHPLMATPYARQFASFWEEQLDGINAVFGTDAQTWPPLLNFCRIVRNASSHSGRVNILSPNSPSGTWRGRTIGYKNHGEILIGAHEMELSDLMLLLRDFSEFLNLNRVCMPIIPLPHNKINP